MNKILGVLRRLNILNRGLNRGLPAHAEIRLNHYWPLCFIPIAIVNQLLTPHSVWMILLVTLTGLYSLAYLWVRSQAQQVRLTRVQKGSMLVAGDSMSEEFTLYNQSHLPIAWVELVDHSDLPGYLPGRVVGCDGQGSNQWRMTAQCKRRGLFRLGPHELRLSDPFGLFSLLLQDTNSQSVLVYPRVVQLPRQLLPRGSNAGSEHQRRIYRGNLPSASVRHHMPLDSLRFIHWPTTAHRNQLMVKELEQEPGGDVWIVVDGYHASHSGEGAQSTFEMAIIAAAGLAANLLTGSERRAVGFLALSGSGSAIQPILLPPQAGSAQLWRILAGLASLQPCDRPLAVLLRQQLDRLRHRQSIIVITALPLHQVILHKDQDGNLPRRFDSATTSMDIPFPVDVVRLDWLPELLRLHGQQQAASVLTVLAPGSEAAFEALRLDLARYDLPVQPLPVDAVLRTLITFRRRRTELRTTPSGGTVAVEVEEEVG